MNEYSVLLAYPADDCDGEPCTFYAWVRAFSPADAIWRAQLDCWFANTDQEDENLEQWPIDDVHDLSNFHRQPEDYEALLVIRGIHRGL